MVQALEWPSAEVLVELLKHGGNPNSKPFGLYRRTLLHVLCSETTIDRMDRMAKIEALVEANVDPNMKDEVFKNLVVC